MVLESQYQSSLTKACQAINESREDVCVECVGYLLEELRDDVNLAAFKKDVETSNIFIGSLIFVQVGAVSFVLSLPRMLPSMRADGFDCLGKLFFPAGVERSFVPITPVDCEKHAFRCHRLGYCS